MFGNTVALCGHCRKQVPARHEAREGKIFLVKDCPTCGRNETMASSDAAAWQRKREIWGYTGEEETHCGLQCNSCRIDHTPSIVLVETTNRCNMDCPICIAGIQSVGFDYNPPLEYFQKLFESLRGLNPRPFVDLYGGEPTVREDLIDIIKLARRHDLKARVVTNGVRLADEEYCQKLCAVRVPLRFSFDGRDPEIYRKLRGDAGVYQTKLKALANLKKYSRRKNSMLTCLGKDVNSGHVTDLFDFCHEYRDVFDQVGFIPLKEDWHTGPDRITTQQMNPEAVEQAIRDAVVDGNVEFISAGIVHCLAQTRSFFTERKVSKNFMFAGSHPNCESMTFLVSDGRQYRSINHYLKIPLQRLTEEVLTRARKLDRKLSRLNPKKFLDRWYGRLLTINTFLPVGLRAVNFKAIFKGNPCWGVAKVLAGPLKGERIWQSLRRVTGIPAFLRVGVLPFEEYLAVDAQRLANCKGMFAYEDVKDEKVKLIPVCTWFLYRKGVLKTIAEKYGVAPATPPSASQAKPTVTT
jgi:7,8-dihydro-6-hydroxymethylpterin dimethyltransferase